MKEPEKKMGMDTGSTNWQTRIAIILTRSGIFTMMNGCRTLNLCFRIFHGGESGVVEKMPSGVVFRIYASKLSPRGAVDNKE